MKVVIVNCFDTYENRLDIVHGFLKDQGYDVTIVQSDYRHFKKNYRDETKEDFVFVKTKSYRKNLSFARLKSHYIFSKDAFNIIEKIKPDVLYVFAPPNSLMKDAVKYKLKHKEVKLIFDLIDLWPETMPIGIKKWPPFLLWSSLRDNNLKYADLVITECDLYQEILKEKLKGINTKTIYLAKKNIETVSKHNFSDDEIHLAYLGSINNIIDILKIKKIIQEINEIKPVKLHIIGDGEKKRELVESVQKTGATVIYHGKVYDSQKKQEIFDNCHFGLNIMKDSVCVGLTMKSIDYFQHGLPIINNIPSDTARMVQTYGVGINVLGMKAGQTNFKVEDFTQDSILHMKKKSIKLYEKFFSIESCINEYKSAFKGLF